MLGKINKKYELGNIKNAGDGAFDYTSSHFFSIKILWMLRKVNWSNITNKEGSCENGY